MRNTLKTQLWCGQVIGGVLEPGVVQTSMDKYRVRVVPMDFVDGMSQPAKPRVCKLEILFQFSLVCGAGLVASECLRNLA